MDRNRWLAVVGSIALLAGLAVALVYEAGTTSEPELFYPVSWTVTEAGSQERSGHLSEGEQANLSFTLPASNTSRLRVHLGWEDDVGQPDRFNLTVEGPGPLKARTVTGTNGSLVLAFSLAEVPTVDGVAAFSQGQAGQRLAEEHASQAGRGQWNVTVILEEAPGQRPVPQASDVETQPDGQNRFEVRFTYETYRAVLGEPRIPA